MMPISRQMVSTSSTGRLDYASCGTYREARQDSRYSVGGLLHAATSIASPDPRTWNKREGVFSKPDALVPGLNARLVSLVVAVGQGKAEGGGRIGAVQDVVEAQPRRKTGCAQRRVRSVAIIVLNNEHRQ